MIREEVLMLLFHAQIEPREAEELTRSDDVDGGASPMSTKRSRGLTRLRQRGSGATA